MLYFKSIVSVEFARNLLLRSPDEQDVHPERRIIGPHFNSAAGYMHHFQFYVTLKEFWIDNHEVTNAEFQQFVNATHYITIAERKPDPKDFPGFRQPAWLRAPAYLLRQITR